MEHLAYSKDFDLFDEDNEDETDSIFINNRDVKEYELNRNEHFTPTKQDIYVLIDAYRSQGSNPSNFSYRLFDSTKEDHTSGHSVYRNIVGAQLKRVLINSSLTETTCVDILCDTLPYCACIDNSRRDHLLTRMVLDGGANNYSDFEPSMYYENTFYPISLDHFSIRVVNSETRVEISDLNSITLEFKLDVLNDVTIVE